jgi:hypothetical protein
MSSDACRFPAAPARPVLAAVTGQAVGANRFQPLCGSARPLQAEGSGMATKTVLSNVDLIRRFVFEHQPVSGEQIAAYVTQEMASAKDPSAALERYVAPVLKAQPYYRLTDGKWETVREQMPEYRVLRDVLREEKRLLYERDVKSRIARKLGMKVVSVVCDLTQAPELSKHDSFWGLKEWVIANDQAAEVLRSHPNGISEKDLHKQVCDRYKLDPETTVLHLAGDKQKRFTNDRKLWFLKSEYDKSRAAKPAATAKLPELKTGGVELLLEGNFVLASTSKGDEARAGKERAAKTRLKKAQVREAIQVLEQREDLAPKEDLAVRMSQVLRDAGVDEYAVRSFQRVERAGKERGLSPKERDEIQEFMDQLMRQETVGVGPSEQSVASAPLSARKVVDVLRLKHLAYFRDRAVLPSEFYRLLVRVLRPTVNDGVLNPTAFEGLLAVELFSYLFDALDGAAWALADEGQELEIVQPDGARYRISSQDKQLADRARDKFTVSQVDLLEHFINFKYTGIEADKTLARAARTITRLSGFENVYIANRDYFSELPQIFGLEPDEDNEIPQRFDCIIGNFTFTQDDNLAANYLDQSLKLLAPGGRLAVFVTDGLLKLLKQHGLLGEFLGGRAVTHFIRLPLIEGRHNVVQLHIKTHHDGEPPQIVYVEVEDLKAATGLVQVLQDAETADPAVRRVEQLGLGQLIG